MALYVPAKPQISLLHLRQRGHRCDPLQALFIKLMAEQYVIALCFLLPCCISGIEFVAAILCGPSHLSRQ